MGTLAIVESDAIVVDADNRLKWVPREVILFVELNPQDVAHEFESQEF